MDKKTNLNNQADGAVENVLAGIVGAFLFSLAGGILWFGMYVVGYLVAISGLVGVVCAIKGYSIFSKKESTKGIIISTVIAFIVLVIAWYLCFAYDIFDVHRIWFESGAIDYKITFSEAVSFVPLYLFDPEIGPAYLKDLGMGLLLGLIGAGSYVFNKIKSNKKRKIASNAKQINEEPVPAENEEEIAPVVIDAAESATDNKATITESEESNSDAAV